VHHRFIAGAHEFTWGLNHRHSSDSTWGSAFASFLPLERSLNWTSLYVHDEWALVPERLRLMLGARVEHDTYSGTNFQPNARLAWSPDTLTTIWGAVSRAARTPSRGDREVFIQLPVIPPGTALNPGPLPVLPRAVPSTPNAETVDAVEMGWRRLWGQRLSTDVSLFYNQYRDFRGYRQLPQQVLFVPVPHVLADLSLVNDIKGEIYGAELAANLRATDSVRLRLAYSNANSRFRNGLDAEDAVTRLVVGASPRHKTSLQTSIDITARQQLDFWLRHVGALDYAAIPSYTTLDMRYGWRVARNFDVALVGQNLLERRHVEFIQDNIPAPTREMQRGVYLRSELRFQLVFCPIVSECCCASSSHCCWRACV
jgi:iron complex outermembrane recepter protein